MGHFGQRTSAGVRSGAVGAGLPGFPEQPLCAVSPTITATVTYTDFAGLQRSVPIAIRIPISAPLPMPVVIWSHGGAGGHTSPERSSVEWSETTAEAGYLTISMAHLPARIPGYTHGYLALR